MISSEYMGADTLLVCLLAGISEPLTIKVPGMQRFTDGWRCTGMKIDVLPTRGNAEAVQTSPLDA